MVTKTGLVHLYTGEGKGKTTAAVGLCVRAVGAGLRVLFVQFMKGRDTGELAPLAALGVTVFRAHKIEKFVRAMTDAEKAACRTAQGENLAYARDHLREYDLVVLDEVVSAVTTGMLPLEAVCDVLRAISTGGADEGPDVVLTGRNAPEALQKAADYLSCVEARRHPFQQGIPARQGVEF